MLRSSANGTIFHRYHEWWMGEKCMCLTGLLASNVVPWAVMLHVLLFLPLVTMTENSYRVLGFSPVTTWLRLVVLAVWKRQRDELMWGLKKLFSFFAIRAQTKELVNNYSCLKKVFSVLAIYEQRVFGTFFRKPFDLKSLYLKLGVCRYVGLPAHCVVARICDFLVLGQRVVGPRDFDGVVARNRSLNAHGRHHGNGVWYWSVWRMEKFVQINIRVYGVCKPLT